VAVAEKVSALRTERCIAERAARADIPKALGLLKALGILKRAGVGRRPVKGRRVVSTQRETGVISHERIGAGHSPVLV
jgi:hypothetical protein